LSRDPSQNSTGKNNFSYSEYENQIIFFRQSPTDGGASYYNRGHDGVISIIVVGQDEK
jgi:hypothetical protein